MSFYVSEGEPDTLKRKQGFVLCLRGHMCLCMFVCECVGAPQVVQHVEKSSADEESKWVLFFCVDRRTLCILVLSQQGQIIVHTLL